MQHENATACNNFLFNQLSSIEGFDVLVVGAGSFAKHLLDEFQLIAAAEQGKSVQRLYKTTWYHL